MFRWSNLPRIDAHLAQRAKVRPRSSDHFDGRRFHNPRRVEHGFGQFLKWCLTARPGPWRRQETPSDPPPPPPRVGSEALVLTFVNHASVLIQTAGLNILTDPLWSERTSPVRWAGPRRYQPAGVALADLPPIDVVLVSHNHYDHMDVPTLRHLARSHDPHFVTPLGNGRHLARAGIARITEHDWWDELELTPGVCLHTVPAQHWSKRGLFDRNRALWAGFYLDAPPFRVFFAGDTAMEGHFEHIRTRLGAPSVALLPIGAYKPRWFMGRVHLSPREALVAHRMLGARLTMVVHFGTFALGDDGQDEPVAALREAMAEMGFDSSAVWIPTNGARLRLDAGPHSS